MAGYLRTVLFGVAALLFIETAYGFKVCKTFVKKHGCSAEDGNFVEVCPVPNVDKILFAQVHQLAGQTNCTYHPYPLDPAATEAFTYNETHIFTSGNSCRAVFAVVYEECRHDPVKDCTEKVKRHGCTANAGVQSYRCRIPQVGEIKYALVHNEAAGYHHDPQCIPTSYPLLDNETSHYTWNKNFIYMGKFCRMVVDVYYDDCTYHGGSCTIHGDPHIKTFDDYHCMFGGDYPCKYTLAEHGSCSVKGTLHQCHGGRTCLKDLWLTNGNYNIYIGHGNVVDRIEGGTSTAVTLPYQDNELHLLMNELGPYDLMAVMLDCKMAVYFDGDKMAAIVADNSLKGDMSGICMDFDEDMDNDDHSCLNPNNYKDDPYCPNIGP